MTEESSIPPIPSPPKRDRRQMLQWAAGGVAAAVGVGFLGYRAIVTRQTPIRLGIAPGTQTLWRYVAQRQVELFGGSKYALTFANYADETALRLAFVGGQIDVMASLVPTVASLSEAGVAAKLFLPTAWLHEGFPFVVPDGSSIVDLASLRGRRVAMYPLDHPGMAYWHALSFATTSLPLTALRPIETLTPDVSLVSKSVDAACLGGAQWASLQGRPGFHKVTDLQTTWGAYSGSKRPLVFGGFIARREFLDRDPEFVSMFAKAHVDALKTYQSDRSRFLDITAAYSSRESTPPPPKMSAAQNQSQATYLGYDDIDTGRFILSEDDIADYQRLFELMAKGGYLKAPLTDVPSFFYRAPST